MLQQVSLILMPEALVLEGTNGKAQVKFRGKNWLIYYDTKK